jgi:glycosyltransferase involved in cell wall biosynthesis
MDTPKVGLIEARTSFLNYKLAGTDFYGYAYYLSQGLKRISNNTDIIPIKVSNTLGKGFSIMLDSFTRDFNRYDVIHNLDLNPFFPVRKGKAVTISTVHDLAFILDKKSNEDVNRTMKGLIWLNVIIRLGLYSALKSDYLIAVSTLTKDDLIKLGYEKGKIYVVNHGISKQFFTRKKKIGNSGKRFIIGYLGALRTRKNPGFFIDAFKHLQNEKYELRIWGKLGYDRDNLINKIHGTKNIYFKGFAPEDRLVDIYDSFNAFVFPSLYEGFGLPIIEAQSRGIPVIIYRNGRIPEEVRKYCFEAEDPGHMAQLIENFRENGYNEKSRYRAIKYARSFTWEKTADQTLKAYIKIKEQSQ